MINTFRKYPCCSIQCSANPARPVSGKLSVILRWRTNRSFVLWLVCSTTIVAWVLNSSVGDFFLAHSSILAGGNHTHQYKKFRVTQLTSFCYRGPRSENWLELFLFPSFSTTFVQQVKIYKPYRWKLINSVWLLANIHRLLQTCICFLNYITMVKYRCSTVVNMGDIFVCTSFHSLTLTNALLYRTLSITSSSADEMTMDSFHTAYTHHPIPWISSLVALVTNEH